MADEKEPTIKMKPLISLLSTTLIDDVKGELASGARDTTSVFAQVRKILAAFVAFLDYLPRIKKVLADILCQVFPEQTKGKPRGADFPFFEFFTNSDVIGAIVSIVVGFIDLLKGDSSRARSFFGPSDDTIQKITDKLVEIKKVVEANSLTETQLKVLFTEPVAALKKVIETRSKSDVQAGIEDFFEQNELGGALIVRPKIDE